MKPKNTPPKTLNFKTLNSWNLFLWLGRHHSFLFFAFFLSGSRFPPHIIPTHLHDSFRIISACIYIYIYTHTHTHTHTLSKGASCASRDHTKRTTTTTAAFLFCFCQRGRRKKKKEQRKEKRVRQDYTSKLWTERRRRRRRRSNCV